jgi:hypothetical protein
MGGRFNLVKSILEAIPICLMSLGYILKAILEEIRRIGYRFLFFGDKKMQGIAWVNWREIALPKDCRGVDLNIFISSQKLWKLSVDGG